MSNGCTHIPKVTMQTPVNTVPETLTPCLLKQGHDQPNKTLSTGEGFVWLASG